MRVIRWILPMMLVIGGCATSPLAEEERQKIEEEIVTILSRPLDASEYGERRRCLSTHAYRDIEILDDQRILFEGRGGKLWLNQLRTRCVSLHPHSTIAFDLHTNQLCDMDHFTIVDWSYWPRFRRWPWLWGNGIQCTLDKFQPVSQEQVEAIRAALEK